jgi:hypothetical protein
MTARLKAKIEANQAKTDVNLKEMEEETLAKKENHQQRMIAWVGKTEVTDLEANPEEIESVAVHEEVHKEEAAVICIRALKKRHRGRNIAGRHRIPKERTQGKGQYQ